ncbi:MAG: AzlC family ABC transporter permease [Pseudomonadota bacterium]
MTSHQEAVKGFCEITPLSLGVLVYGFAFGLLAAQAQMTGLQAGLMSTLVFAGSSQIVGVERLVSGAGLLSSLAAGLTLNVRILLMTSSLRQEFSGRPLWQVLLGAHLTTDENWGLMHATRSKGYAVGYWYLVGGGLSLLLFWVTSTVSGVIFAQVLPSPRALGIDFAFTAAFIAVMTSLWGGKSDVAPWTISIVACLFSALVLPVEPSWALIIGGLCGAFFAGFQTHE